MKQEFAARSYIPELDGLRAFAVAFVVYSHLYQEGKSEGIQWGWLGVGLFFVLSGYLITSILIDYRRRIEESASDLATCLRRFYLRRALRIFPAYYTTVALCWLLNIRSVREPLLWHLFYGSNFWFAANNSWEGPVAHFWSLSVEEQFYCFWPLTILQISRRKHAAASIGLTLAGLVFLLVGPVFGLSALSLYLLTPTSFVPLGVGAILAALNSAQQRSTALNSAQQRSTALNSEFKGFVFLLALSCILRVKVLFLPGLISQVAVYVFFAILVNEASGSPGSKSHLLRPLAWPPLVFIGKISYGIYLYHNLVPVVMRPISDRLGLSLPAPGITRFILYVIITIFVSFLSWICLENPINRLKARV